MYSLPAAMPHRGEARTFGRLVATPPDGRAAHTSSISECLRNSFAHAADSVRQDLGHAQPKMPPMMEAVNFLPIGLVRFAISPVASHGRESLGEELAWWINKTLGLLGWFIAAVCQPSFIVSCTPEWSATSFSLAMCVMSTPGRLPRPSQSI